MIACVRVPYFAAAVERRDNAQLTHQPLVIGGQPWQVRPVYAVSAETVPYGIDRGLPLRRAHALCPHAAFLPTAERAYQQTVLDVGGLIRQFTDVTEPRWTYPALIYYLDCLDVHGAQLVRYAQQLGRTVRDVAGLTPSIGIGDNKFVAYVAAKLTRPQRLHVVQPASVQPFLDHVPLNRFQLPPTLHDRLHLFGIRTFGQLARLPADDIRQQFGDAGVVLHQLARGIDLRPIQPPPEPRMVSVHIPFDDPVAHFQPLEAHLSRIAAQWESGLCETSHATQKLMLWLALASGQTLAPSVLLPQPVQAADLIYRQLHRLLHHDAFDSGVVALRATMSEIAPVEMAQLSLFDFLQPPSADSLQAVIDEMTARYGSRVFVRAEAQHPDAHVAERRFKWRKMAGSQRTAFFPLPASHAITVFPDADGAFSRFIWQHRAHTVVDIVKAWRIDYGWWEQHIQRDYYKLITDSDLLVTIYYDAVSDEWFISRVYN